MVNPNLTLYKVLDEDNDLYYDVKQILTYQPQASHDGRQLRCVSHHPGYNSTDIDNEDHVAWFNISVEGMS